MISVGFMKKLMECNENRDTIPKNIFESIEREMEKGEFGLE